MFPCLYICIYPSVYTSSLPVYLSSPSRLLNFSWKFMEVDATSASRLLSLWDNSRSQKHSQAPP